VSEGMEDTIRGLRAAARLTGRSVSGLQKMVEQGRLRADKDDLGYAFERADLDKLRRPARQAPRVTGSRSTSAEAATAEGRAPRTGLVLGTLAPLEDSSVNRDAAEPPTSGKLAAEVFALFAADRAPVDVVVERGLPPAEVEQLYHAWLRMQALDSTSAAARSRIGILEDAVADLRRELAAVATTLDEVSTRAEGATSAILRLNGPAATAARVVPRLAALERRLAGDGTAVALGEMGQRLALLEGQLRAMPMAHAPFDRRCARCHRGTLVVPACCPTCGWGIGPPGA
jgi:hypothetical protein